LKTKDKNFRKLYKLNNAEKLWSLGEESKNIRKSYRVSGRNPKGVSRFSVGHSGGPKDDQVTGLGEM
jgi:hypothetical protein